MTEIRIGDAEREAAVAALGEHYAAGRLTKEEYDERAEQAWVARASSALAPLFVDLPAPSWNRPTMASTTSTGPSYTRRQPALTDRPRRGFRPPFLPVLLVVLGLAMLVNVPWPFLLLFGWLLWRGLAFRAFGARRWSQQSGQGWPRGRC